MNTGGIITKRECRGAHKRPDKELLIMAEGGMCSASDQRLGKEFVGCGLPGSLLLLGLFLVWWLG